MCVCIHTDMVLQTHTYIVCIYTRTYMYTAKCTTNSTFCECWKFNQMRQVARHTYMYVCMSVWVVSLWHHWTWPTATDTPTYVHIRTCNGQTLYIAPCMYIHIIPTARVTCLSSWEPCRGGEEGWWQPTQARCVRQRKNYATQMEKRAVDDYYDNWTWHSLLATYFYWYPIPRTAQLPRALLSHPLSVSLPPPSQSSALDSNVSMPYSELPCKRMHIRICACIDQEDLGQWGNTCTHASLVYAHVHVHTYIRIYIRMK